MTTTRRSYEATVLLVPLDPTSRAWTTTRPTAELAGVNVADDQLTRSAPPDTLPRDGEGVARSTPLEHAVHRADVVVVLTNDLAQADTDLVVRAGDAARANGTLLGAVVVAPEARWSDPASESTAAVIRESADSVVVLADDRFVSPFLQVLRGGTRDERLEVSA